MRDRLRAGFRGSLAAAGLLVVLACPFCVAPGTAAGQEPSPAGDQFGDSEAVSRGFEQILSQPEFRRLRSKAPQIPEGDIQAPGWLKRFFSWLGDLFKGAGNGIASLGPVLQVLAYAVLAAIGCAIIWLLVRAVNAYRQRQTVGRKRGRNYEEGEAEMPPGDLPADEYLRRASELAAQEKFREAIGQLILGAMSHTERSGLIRFRRGLTHRDYLRALRGRGAQHQALRMIVDVYEPICFGRRPAQFDHYRMSLEGYQTGFRQSTEAASK